jgi:two-component system LytT family sensor kinase
VLPLRENTSSVVLNPLLQENNKWYLLLSISVLAGVHFFGVYHWLNLAASPAMADALLSWFSLGFTVFMIVNTLSFYHPSRGRFLMVVLVPLIVAYGWQQLMQWMLLSGIDNPEYRVFIREHSLYRLSVSYLILTGAFLFALVWYRLGEREDIQRRREETSQLAKDAELFKLRQQLQPHFLFNSLNSINSLIGSRPEVARKMVQQLSAFLRGTIRRDDQVLISLKEELEHLRLYLQIEEVRFGNRLKVNIQVDEAHLELQLPPLILQPILENAIKFGLYGTLDQVQIVLQSDLQQNRLHLSISNPFDDDVEAERGEGFGLRSVKRRLQLLYGQLDLLEVKKEAQQFTAIIKVPLAND